MGKRGGKAGYKREDRMMVDRRGREGDDGGEERGGEDLGVCRADHPGPLYTARREAAVPNRYK